MKQLFLCATAAIVITASQALASGDIVKGKKLSNKCKSCHTLNEGGKNRLGPNLFDILNKPAGAVEGYKYSKAMSASGIVWDDSTFIEFVAKPKKVVKGTKMSFKGIKKATQRADLLAYFKSLRNKTDESANPPNISDGKTAATKHCIVCHSFEKEGKMVYGPNLYGIAGMPAGTAAGYVYSEALKNSGLVWTDKNLIGFMANPEQFLRGTKARFPGLKSAKEKAGILAYIKSLK